MKRLFLTVVAVLSMTMTFAEDEKLNNVESAAILLIVIKSTAFFLVT